MKKIMILVVGILLFGCLAISPKINDKLSVCDPGWSDRPPTLVYYIFG